MTEQKQPFYAPNTTLADHNKEEGVRPTRTNIWGAAYNSFAGMRCLCCIVTVLSLKADKRIDKELSQ